MRIRFLFLIALLYSCKDNRTVVVEDTINNRTVVLDDNTKAVGKISSDTIYNGLIKFYDNNSNKLLKEYFYKNGRREGAATEYFKNGSIAAKLSFKNDKRDGYAFYYNDSGKLIQKDFFYYDILVGPSYNYDEDVYKFFSLDGEELLKLSYRSLRTAKSVMYQMC